MVRFADGLWATGLDPAVIARFDWGAGFGVTRSAPSNFGVPSIPQRLDQLPTTPGVAARKAMAAAEGQIATVSN
jgi:hypothetical protein